MSGIPSTKSTMKRKHIYSISPDSLLQSNTCFINNAQTLESIRITQRGSKHAHPWALSLEIPNQQIWREGLRICIPQKLMWLVPDDTVIFLPSSPALERREENPQKCEPMQITIPQIYCTAAPLPCPQYIMPWPSHSHSNSLIKHSLTHYRLQRVLCSLFFFFFLSFFFFFSLRERVSTKVCKWGWQGGQKERRERKSQTGSMLSMELNAWFDLMTMRS